jgi:hypothetical protein
VTPEIEAAVAAERARIVAWLRARASSPGIDWRAFDDDDDGPSPSSALRSAADDLEREEVTP